MSDQTLTDRRRFTTNSLIAGVTWTALVSSDVISGLMNRGSVHADELHAAERPYGLTLDSPTRRFDGKTCWCHPRAGILPGTGDGGKPAVVMTMNVLDLAGSDVFRAMFDMRTDNLGEQWSQPREVAALAPRCEVYDGLRRPVAASDFWPRWHAKSKTLLGTGHTVVYTPDWTVVPIRPRHTIFATYDPAKGDWNQWQKLDVPDEEKFYSAGAGCTQRVDLADGDILLPITWKTRETNYRTVVARCSFDGKTMRLKELGSDLKLDGTTRGLYEPSLTKFQDRYFLTLRNDLKGYVARSNDGMDFEPYRPWKFDDGSDLGNYNTQQHWVSHSDALFLVYTRRGANNDHVFRHRAPLFMAQVDPDRLVVLRATEQILVPERGARLGNFGVTEISPDETWVTVAEWMQPRGVEKRGSDGSVFIARIRWTKPNRTFS